MYRNDKTGGEILLDADGTFSATDISEGEVTGWGSADPVDFSGRWDLTRSNFVYLEADDGELDVDVQLYMAGPKKVYLRPDPDGPVTLKLTKAAAPKILRAQSGAWRAWGGWSGGGAPSPGW